MSTFRAEWNPGSRTVGLLGDGCQSAIGESAAKSRLQPIGSAESGLNRTGARTTTPLSRGPHEFIEDQVERTPDSTALTLGQEQISYRELNSRANRLAHFLCAQELGPEGLVGVCLNRSFDSVISILAILKAGKTYLPLDPNFPKDRLAFMLADSEVSFLLTHSSLCDGLPETSARLVLLDRESFSDAAVANLPSSTSPEALAYLIYTSGSTGKPKGVMIPRRALANFLLSMAEKPGMTCSDTLLAVTTSSFDISMLEFLLPLTRGAQIVIATAEQASDGRELQRLLRQHAVTVMQATPATWRMMIESNWEGKSDLRIFCGGEALTAELRDKLLPRCSELWNMYGPTETTIWSSTERVSSAGQISLGLPIANTQFHVLDDDLKPVSPGAPGELCIGGTGLARGYLKRPELTAERFVSLPGSADPDARLYRTGDQVRYRLDGTLEFLGRLDQQVKLHGFRIELGEIESALAAIEGIGSAVVILREDHPGEKRLVAYYTGRADLSSTFLLHTLKATLPDYMIPSVFLRLEKFPLTPNAKVNRKALPQPERKRPVLAQEFIAPRTAEERRLASLWCELLGLEEVGIDDSFFDLGGNSLAAVRMVSCYHTRFGREIPAVKLFQYPTIAKLSEFLKGNGTQTGFLVEAENRSRHRRPPHNGNDGTRDAVAVIGMAGRFPGAANLDQLWRNLCDGVESISFFSPEELGPGIDESLRHNPDYIRARGLIDGAELFDAAFFGINPLEAKVMDPQQRVFLELAQQALENAGYDPERCKERIGVFAGVGDNHYYTTNLLTQPDLLAMAGKLAVEYGNQKDYIALRTAYLLDLRGPAISVNTACSTTLLTVDQAYRSLLDHECDIALTGGVDITVPQKSGFLYQQGGTFTKDGHCRPFDAEATGTMFCDGAGVVILKRLADAVADGDTIYAVIRGTGKNNNGSRPASFLAPSIDGQVEAIALAQANADVSVESIGYIEAHGTGTPVGDPIEFGALRRVFESKTDRKQFCYIGSIKGNIGHPTNAAGVAGLIKAALVLDREQIPPTLHFKNANPKIEFASSPFLMADKLIPFPRGKEIRRTAVSSFGFGGTNVHVILEEAPLPKAARPSRPLQLFTLSARTPGALHAYADALAEHLDRAAPEAFADAAYTFQTGRKQMAHRSFVVAADSVEAAQLLRHPNPLRCAGKRCDRRNPPVVFLFGGQGTQYVNMGLNLYRGEPLFRAVVDQCCESLKPHLGRDLRELLYPRSGDEETAKMSLEDTFFTQPSIFVIEYALARFWQSLGVEPALMAGHSIGEFVAATLANVWELNDALGLIALRGRLMQNLPRGAMMAVSSSADSIAKILPPRLQIASNNAPALCVVSGPEPDVNQFQKQLEEKTIVCRRLHTSHAFHSAMMDPIVEPLREAVARINLRPPAKPIVSTVIGRALTGAETTDPAYWSRHSRATVEFSKAIQWANEQGYDLFLECGPRSTLCALTRQHFAVNHPCTAIPTFADTHENNAEWATVLFALGSLWQNGVPIDWDAFYANEERRRIPLPTYPFERQRYWVDPITPAAESFQRAPSTSVVAELSPAPAPPESPTGTSSTASRKDRFASRVLDLLVPLSGRERSEISTSATFMEQGFDSLSLTQIAFALGKEFSVKVSFSQLMNDFPNIDMLAAHLDATQPADRLVETPRAPAVMATSTTVSPSIAAPRAVDTSTRQGTLEGVVADQARAIARLAALLEKAREISPASVAAAGAEVPESHSETAAPEPSEVLEVESTVPQRGIYASSRLSSRLSASYNESMTLRLTGNISLEKLRCAVERLVERHDALRASFDETGLVMKIVTVQKIATPVIDLSSIKEPAQQEQRLRKLIADEASLPFSLPLGPLFRCQIVLLGPDRAAVIFTAHHVICDGWSLDVLIHDLCAFYSEEISGAPASLEPPNRYVEYVKSLAQRYRSEEFSGAASYWQSKFEDGFPVLRLPTDHPRSARREFSASHVDHPIPGALVKSLRAAGAKERCSFFAILLGSLALLLARISRQRRFVIALPTAEQPVVGQPNLVGHCVNLVPFAVEVRPNESIAAFLRRVQSDLLAAQDHAVFTVISLLEDLHPVVPAVGVSPISVGLTNIKKFKPHELPQHGFSIDYDANPKAYESFEFYLNAVEMEDDLKLRCHYDNKLFEDSSIRQWLATLDSTFQTIATDRSREVLDLVRLNRSDSPPATEFMYTRTFGRADATSAEARPYASLDASESSSMAESALCRELIPLWQRVLNITTIGPDDDFFALGGHSIGAARLFALIQQELRCVAPLASLYEAPTPRMLAGVLSRLSKGEDWQSQPATSRSNQGESEDLVHRSSPAHSNGKNVVRRYVEAVDQRSARDSCMPGVSEDPAIAVHEAAVKLSTAERSPLRDNTGHAPGLVCSDAGVRPFVEDDLEQVADLWWTIVRHGGRPAPPALRSYFHELYFAGHPWIDNTMPSLVYQGRGGDIVGFLGVIRRTMSMRGETIRVAMGGNFVVHPEARSSPAALRMLAAYMEGGQDLSLSDSANEPSRIILEQLGFRTFIPLSVSWARPLRPSAYAVHVVTSQTGPFLSAGLKFATKPLCRVVDSVDARLSASPFRKLESPLRATDMDAETLLQCLTEFGGRYSLRAEYDLPWLEQLLTFIGQMHPQSKLRKVILRDHADKILGWYLYYLKAGEVGRVLQIGGERESLKDVLSHLFCDAWNCGAIGLHGAVQGNMMGELAHMNCLFVCRSGWMMAHSRRPELLALLSAGDVFFSRLDGEACLNFND